MEIVMKYAIFVVIGILPTVLREWSVIDWQWWATCAPLWITIYMRDAVTNS